MALSRSTRFHAATQRQGFVIDGLDVVVDDLNRASRLAGLRASRVVVQTAHEVRETMSQLAPVSTGRLRDSIEATEPGGGRLGLGSLEAEVGPTAFYGHMVEFGTSRVGPRPFVMPAGEAHADTFAERLERVAGDI